MIKIIAIYIICLIWIIPVSAQFNLDDQFNYAKNLYEQEKYYEAVTELKRLVYFDESGIYNYEANTLIADSYKQGAKFSDAIRHLTLAEINAETDEQFFYTQVEKARLNILRRTSGNAIEIIDKLKTDKRFSSNIDELNYWKGWAYIFSV